MLVALTGLILGVVLTLMLSYETSGGIPFGHQKPIHEAEQSVTEAAHRIDEYIQDNGHSPTTPNDLVTYIKTKHANPMFRLDADPWGRQPVYTKTGAVTYDVTAYAAGA